MLIDLHTHTTFSDGTLSATDMVAAAEAREYASMAITDHARGQDRDFLDVVRQVGKEVERLRLRTRVNLLIGVELTDFDPDIIHSVAEQVRRAGAQVVVVHGECTSLRVAPGTNAAAVRSSAVDILAHPGLITYEDALHASARGICLEISARLGACYTNGHVCSMAQETDAQLVVNSDGHDAAGLLTESLVQSLLLGAGASAASAYRVLHETTPALLSRLVEGGLRAA